MFSKFVFRVKDHHRSPHTPPEINGDDSDYYASYFANEHGDQSLFVFHYTTREATLWLGDCDWKAFRVVDGVANKAVLNDNESEWLKLVYRTATTFISER